MMSNESIKSILVYGVFRFKGNIESGFKGPIKKGFRPVAWINEEDKRFTSCAFVSDMEIAMGETKNVEIILLNELEFTTSVIPGTVMHIGSIYHEIGDFTITEHRGEWSGGKVS